MKKIVGAKPIALTTGNTKNPALTAGGSTVEFRYSDIPDVEDGLVNHLIGTVLTVAWTLTQSGGTGVALFRDNLVRCILASLSAKQTEYGDAMNENNWRGANLPMALYVGGGYDIEFGGKVPAANAAYTGEENFFIPSPAIGLGRSVLDTVQPIRLWRKALLGVTPAAASVLTAASPGGSLSSMTMRASAIVVPLNKIVVGCPIELKEYKETAAADGSFSFPDFGKSSLDGVEKQAGLIWGCLLTTANGLDGAVAAGNVTALGVPVRRIPRTQHLSAFLKMALAAIPGGKVYASNQDLGTSGAIYSENGPYPYILGSDRGQSGLWNSDLGAMPIGIDPTEDFDLSKVQAHSGTFPIDLDGSSISGSQRGLFLQAKRFTGDKMREFKAILEPIARATNSLKAAKGYRFDYRLADQRRDVDAKAARFLPQELVAA